jgi:hypothetical protein
MPGIEFGHLSILLTTDESFQGYHAVNALRLTFQRQYAFVEFHCGGVIVQINGEFLFEGDLNYLQSRFSLFYVASKYLLQDNASK